VQRTFQWNTDGSLRITDAFTRSPDGLVTFSLHAVASNVRQLSSRQIAYDLPDGTLRLTLPAEPKAVHIHRVDTTCGVTCTYAEGTLVHELRAESV